MTNMNFKKLKVSQSLYKRVIKYLDKKESGYPINMNYYKGIETIPSDVQAMGHWFEYKCTGQTDRHGNTPQPKILKSGKLSASYERMLSQVENFKRIMDFYDFKVTDTGYVFNNEHYSGIADVIAEKDGKKCIIDIKSSGLIDNKWNDFGWHIEKFETPDSDSAFNILIQAIHYKYLAKIEWDIDNCPFYFMVFSTTNEVDCIVYEIEVDEDRMLQHETDLQKMYVYLNKQFITKEKKDLVIPNHKECVKCMFKDDCEFKHDVPKIQTIYV